MYSIPVILAVCWLLQYIVFGGEGQESIQWTLFFISDKTYTMFLALFVALNTSRLDKFLFRTTWGLFSLSVVEWIGFVTGILQHGSAFELIWIIALAISLVFVWDVVKATLTNFFNKP